VADSYSFEEPRQLSSDCRKLATTLGEAFSRNLCLVKSLKSDMELKTACQHKISERSKIKCMPSSFAPFDSNPFYKPSPQIIDIFSLEESFLCFKVPKEAINKRPQGRGAVHMCNGKMGS
jgi:hypothetical protein